jgi:hypothetical protein
MFDIVDAMGRKRSDGYLPEEVLGFLSSIFFMPAIAATSVLATILLPSVALLRGGVITRLYWIGLAAGIFGAVLLFLARLPLCRQRRFWAFGPQELARFHRRMYWLAYLVVRVSVGLLVCDWRGMGRRCPRDY